MATKTYDDGSVNIINNSEGDKTKLTMITDMLTRLTEPERISALISQMFEQGILNEFDIMELKNQGIYKEDGELQQEAKEQEEETRFGRKEITIDSNDDLDELEL